jgi:hypothetical protein
LKLSSGEVEVEEGGLVVECIEVGWEFVEVVLLEDVEGVEDCPEDEAVEDWLEVEETVEVGSRQCA